MAPGSQAENRPFLSQPVVRLALDADTADCSNSRLVNMASPASWSGVTRYIDRSPADSRGSIKTEVKAGSYLDPVSTPSVWPFGRS